MSKEEDSLKFLKTQACVMRVNICCDGCQKKVKKVLHKIDGVYTVSINVEERKLTVVGIVSPDILIKKLNKAGKHAELLSAKGGGGGGGGGGKGQSLTCQLQKLQLEHQLKEHGKAQKDGGGKEHKSQPVPQTQLQEGKGFKDLKFPSFKDLKIPFKKDNHKAAAKLNLPSKEELDDGSDFDDDEDDYDEFDDDEDLDDLDEYSDEELYENPKMMKPNNLQPKGSGVAKDKKESGGDKGGEGSKKGNGGGKNGGDGAHDKKNGGGNNNNIKGGNSNNNAGNHAHSGNKGGGSNNSVGGGLPIGQPHMMGQFGNMQPSMGLMATNNAQGLPAAGTYFQPEMTAGPNPYQQQYLQSLMQQQRMMMNGQDRPMGYGYGQPVYTPYVPQHHPDSMFSDENLNGCSIM